MEPGKTTRDASHRWRKRWLLVHLWLGLTAGAVFVLLGLSGSALVFYRHIDGWLNPQVVIARQPAQEHGYQQILDAIHSAHPGRTRAWRLEIPDPQASNRAYTARYYFADEKRGKHFAPLLVTVNPYTLQVIDSRFWGETVMTFVYDLHYRLLLNQRGELWVAFIGVIMLVSLLSGMVLWWPRLRSALRALSFKRHASIERRVYDLHKLTGVYGLVLLLVLAGTGVMLAEPVWFKPALHRLAPVFEPPALQSHPDSDAAQRMSADEAADRAQQVLPDAKLRWLETPDGEHGVYKLRMQQPREPSARFPQSYVWLDQYRGTVLAERDAQHNSASDSMLAWLHPLHNGEAFGLVGRWLVFAAGLLPLVLFVTGILRWRQKRQGHDLLRQRRHRPNVTPASALQPSGAASLLESAYADINRLAANETHTQQW